MVAPKLTTAERRAKILPNLLGALRMNCLIAGANPSVISDLVMGHARLSIHCRDVGYAQQEIVPKMREHLGLTAQNDVVVQAEYVERGACVCGGDPCRCAIYRAVHVMVYPRPGAPPPPPVNAYALAAQRIDANGQ